MIQYSACILDAEGARLTADEKAFFSETRPMGFILFARNIETADQVQALCDEFREAAGEECLITIDQEGGRVQRLREPLARNWRAPLDHVSQAGQNATRAMYLRYALIAYELRKLGLNSNCAPVADLATSQTHPFLRNRCYAEDLNSVVEIAMAVAQAHLDGGVLPVLKHIPGHGRATMDSHKELPHVTTSRDVLEETDFEAFRRLKNLPVGMSAHIVFEQIDSLPATLSPKMVQTIREEIGFDGLLMTDDISMKALSGMPVDVAKAALKAGCDVALYCNASFEDRVAVAHAVGPLSDQAETRRVRAFERLKPAVSLDIPAIEDELSALMSGHVYG